jgi:hypothetical protein
MMVSSVAVSVSELVRVPKRTVAPEKVVPLEKVSDPLDAVTEPERNWRLELMVSAYCA